VLNLETPRTKHWGHLEKRWKPNSRNKWDSTGETCLGPELGVVLGSTRDDLETVLGPPLGTLGVSLALSWEYYLESTRGGDAGGQGWVHAGDRAGVLEC
jgi:hypothetical protein